MRQEKIYCNVSEEYTEQEGCVGRLGNVPTDWKNTPDFMIKLSIDGIRISSKDLYEIKHSEEIFWKKLRKYHKICFWLVLFIISLTRQKKLKSKLIILPLKL